MRIVETLEERVRLRHTRGRKPIDLILDVRHPQGRDAAWAAMRKLRRFTVLELEHATRINERTLESFMQGLTAAGYLSREPGVRHKGRWAPATWILVRDVGVEAPRVTRKGRPVTQGSLRERMWQAMRILKEFTLPELVASASTPESPVRAGDAKDYVTRLLQAKYLVNNVPRAAGRPARYRLNPMRNSGPLAPMIQSIKQVFDPNLGRVVWPVQP